MTAAEVATLRLRLHDAGFCPVALHNWNDQRLPLRLRGKKPIERDWTRPVLPPYRVRNDALNTGILAAGLRVFDLDIDEPQLAQRLSAEVIRRFGETLIRLRSDGSPRRLLPYRAAEGEPGHLSIAGTKGKLEVLGRGQQFVAFGKHYTSAQLQWMPQAPGEIARDELPSVAEAAVVEFVQAWAPELGAPIPQGKPTASKSLHANLADVASAIRAIPNDEAPDWNWWNTRLMALWAATGGSAAGCELAHEWSARNPAYDADATDERWNHYATSPPGRIGAGTLFHEAVQQGWRRPEPPLAEPPARHDEVPPHPGPPPGNDVQPRVLPLRVATRPYALGALRNGKARVTAGDCTLHDETVSLMRFVRIGVLTLREVSDTMAEAALATGMDEHTAVEKLAAALRASGAR